MLRSVKYGLYGAVLAGVVGGTVAWTNVDKTVTLVVDGQTKHIHTTASEVGDAVRGAGYKTDAHDILAPDSHAEIHDGSKIVLRRGRLLHLDVNGKQQDVWTTAPTVSDALGQLGYSTTDFTSVSRSRRLPLGVTDIAVRTPKLVTLVHDGKTVHISTTDNTVAQLLADLNVAVGQDDRLSMPTSSLLTPDARIVLARVTHSTVTATAALPFATTKKSDSTMLRGDSQIVTAGKKGLARITYAVVYVDGKMAGKTKIKTVVLKAPRTQVEAIGTKKKSLAPNAPPVSPGSAQAIAKQLLAARGWGSEQFNCLVTMWNHESGWSTHASNPSGAYGIPQAMPGSKMASSGPDWRDNATTQIKWGLNYISSRYSTPCGAWSSWQANGGWY